ncbi:MAG: NAD-dependent succinate-semialdehyde dehydrogenase [Chitinophagales bacterium]
MENLRSINPYTGKLIENYKQNTDTEIDKKIKNLHSGYLKWKATHLELRSKTLNDIANVLEQNKHTYAKLMCNEMGKPIVQAIAEVEKCAWVCQYYAENGAQFLENKEIKTDATFSYVSYEPIGILLAVMPWNYPFWQFFRVLAPNIMLGNVVLLKHASNVSGCALALEGIFKTLNLEYNIVAVLLASSNRMESVIKNPLVKAVTLTGSEKAGSIVAATAAKDIKKSVLELGGSNAAIILKDADLKKYISTIAWSRFMNTGQSCIAGKRFLVQEKIYDTFIEMLKKEVANYTSGNPAEETIKIGTMASETLAKELENQLKESIKNGAKILMGGKREGAYFEPTLVEVNDINVPVFEQETFGPLVAIKKFKTTEEAVMLSNFNHFGLGVSIYTDNIEVAKSLIPQLNEGAVFINELVKSDPRLPFGGVKKSGYGRELAQDGILEFANRKTVFIK